MIIDQNLIIIAIHPKRVARPKITIHASAAGCNPLPKRSIAEEKIMASAPTIVNAKTIDGPISFTGGLDEAKVVGTVRFAPHRLQ